MTPDESLSFLQSRRSVRAFEQREVPRQVLERLLAAAVTAPSGTNRQPWRFAVVTSASIRARIVAAVRARVAEIRAVVDRSPHAAEYAAYGDFFHEPLAAAPILVFPQYRLFDDLIARLIASGGGDPAHFSTPSTAMQSDLVATSASVMALLLQAQAEGLGACWMAGPMVAKGDIGEILGIREPWRLVGGIALGWPGEQPEAKGRKPVERVVQWFE